MVIKKRDNLLQQIKYKISFDLYTGTDRYLLRFRSFTVNKNNNDLIYVPNFMQFTHALVFVNKKGQFMSNYSSHKLLRI